MIVTDYFEFFHDVVTHDLFGTVWLIGFVVLTAIIMIIQAIVTSTSGTGFEGVYIFLCILVSAIWPFILLILVIPLAPFFGAYWLTQWVAKEIYSTRKAKEFMKSNMKEEK